MVRTNNQVAELQVEILNQQIGNAPDIASTSVFIEKKKKLDDDLHKRWMMIIGEGAVFIVLLAWAIMRTRSGFKREARVAEQQKNFLLSVTHELRSPLASIGLQAETLQKRELPKEKQMQILSHVLEDTARLNALIGNILLAARIDSHAFALQKQNRNLSAFVEQLVAKIESGIGQNHIFQGTITKDLEVNFDDQAAYSIFTNLLENAVKYSPQGSSISVDLTSVGNTITFSVSDRGKGIPDTIKKSIFERFYRSGSEETRSSKGTGLGLYIVKYLATMHNWDVAVKDNPGGGSIFTVNITRA